MGKGRYDRKPWRIGSCFLYTNANRLAVINDNTSISRARKRTREVFCREMDLTETLPSHDMGNWRPVIDCGVLRIELDEC